MLRAWESNRWLRGYEEENTQKATNKNVCRCNHYYIITQLQNRNKWKKNNFFNHHLIIFFHNNKYNNNKKREEELMMKEDAATLYAHQHQLLAVTRR